jgi:hypothetical protein
MTKNKKNILIRDVDSFKKSMPTTTVPTAPIAVQQAYAVPRGIPFIDCSNNTILIIRNITVKAEGTNFVNPSEYLSIIAHTTSQIPAIIKHIQEFIIYPQIL